MGQDKNDRNAAFWVHNVNHRDETCRVKLKLGPRRPELRWSRTTTKGTLTKTDAMRFCLSPDKQFVECYWDYSGIRSTDNSVESYGGNKLFRASRETLSRDLKFVEADVA